MCARSDCSSLFPLFCCLMDQFSNKNRSGKNSPEIEAELLVNIKCLFTVDAPQVGRHFLLLDGELDGSNIKGTPTTPWCCPMSLATDFIVVRQPQAPTSCIRSDFRCQPHQRNDVRFPIYIRFDFGSNSNGLCKDDSLIFCERLQNPQSSSLPWSQPSDR